jgi:tetratricopeptide (TPR) repeat protein
LRALVGLAEQQIAREQSPERALTAARAAAAALKESEGAPVLLARLSSVTGLWLLKSGKTTEAEAALKTATAAWTKRLAKPEAAASELHWGETAWEALQKVFSDGQRLQEALDAASHAAGLLERIPAKESVADRLDALDNERGVLFVQLGKLREAETAFTRIVDRGGAAVVNARYLRSACRLEQKDVSGARADAEELVKAKGNASNYLAARVFARLAGAVDPPNTAAEQDGGRAVSLLKELTKNKFFTGNRAGLLASDSELDALRQRPDFKELFGPKPAATATANRSAAGP